MPRIMLLGAAVALAALLAQAAADPSIAQTRSTLDIYVIDVEGGNATLFVAPSGKSLLIDTGNVAPAAAVRDAGRIMDAIKHARLAQIDNLIITHWHGDHYGGLAELAKQVRIRNFIDHGPNAPPPLAHNGPAHWIKVTAQTDGTFTVTNTRNGFAKTHEPNGR